MLQALHTSLQDLQSTADHKETEMSQKHAAAIEDMRRKHQEDVRQLRTELDQHRSGSYQSDATRQAAQAELARVQQERDDAQRRLNGSQHELRIKDTEVCC
jgi:septal ring factor EnvC (AmiA/AmiB activator)